MEIDVSSAFIDMKTIDISFSRSVGYFAHQVDVFHTTFGGDDVIATFLVHDRDTIIRSLALHILDKLINEVGIPTETAIQLIVKKFPNNL